MGTKRVLDLVKELYSFNRGSWLSGGFRGACQDGCCRVLEAIPRRENRRGQTSRLWVEDLIKDELSESSRALRNFIQQ